MSRVRSPNYPQISLAEAVRRIDQIRSKEGRNAASREVLAKLLGFSGLNGASMGVLSAISKYGLFEDAGSKELKVSDLADAILFPHDPSEKGSALVQAANKPALFAEINEKWPDHPPSDENLRSYLMRRGFSQGALDNAIACYRETMALVTAEVGGYDSTDRSPLREPSSPMPADPHSTPQRRDLPPQAPQVPVISIMNDHIVVNMTVRTRERARALRAMIEMVEGMLPENLDASASQETPKTGAE